MIICKLFFPIHQYINKSHSDLEPHIWVNANHWQWTCNQNTFIFIQRNAFPNVVCKMAAILFRSQCVKGNIVFIAAFTTRKKSDIPLTKTYWLGLWYEYTTITMTYLGCNYPSMVLLKHRWITSWMINHVSLFCMDVVTYSCLNFRTGLPISIDKERSPKCVDKNHDLNKFNSTSKSST